MKPSKSPENAEVTPSKKKLKQARLPFKLISEVSPTPVTPQTRKRKLSAADAETVNKIGKLSKENDLADHTVVISDDETVITDKSSEQQKPLNPFVKLVDTAWKKKLQKGKKKKTGKKSKDDLNGSKDIESSVNVISESKNEVECMDVDIPLQGDENAVHESNEKPVQEVQTPNTKKATPKQKSARKSRSSPRSTSKSPGKSNICNGIDVVLVEDSDKFEKNVSDKVAIEEKDDESLLHKEKIVQKDTPIDVQEKSDQIKAEAVPNEISSDPETSKDEDSSAIQNKGEDLPAKDQKSAQKTDDDTSSDSNKQTRDAQDKNETIPNPITPKRSSRSKTKVEEKEKILNKSTSKLDESISSNPVTPKQNRSLSVTNSLDDSLNESTASANLTPKQLQKKMEAAKKKEERDKEKQEREKKKQLEKEEKAKQRQEKEDQRKKEREEKEEAKRKEREEKEEQRKKEKEEKDRQKELEKKLREEKEEQKKKEKEEKEEQKRKEKEAKEEDRRKKQEALELEKQEQELKKKKAAEAFVNFFVPKQKSEKDQISAGPVSKSSVLSSFAIKSDMRLAPTIRVNLSDEKKASLEDLMANQNMKKNALYLNSLKDGTTKPLSDGKTWPLSEKDDDVMIVEDELPLGGAGEIVTCEPTLREKLRPKLLSFHKNRRPPYWGTWRKKSANVTPRRPFGQDKKYVDYEVDSDEEWEEEPEGESVDGSAAGSDVEEDGDEYEVDNELFVPHGYLSDEEATMDDDDVMSLTPETQKARLKHLEDEFESEMKKPTEKLKPRLYGILWETSEGGKPENCVDALWNYFSKFAMIMDDPTPHMQPSSEPEESEKKKVKKKKLVNDAEKQSPKSDKKKKPKPENKETKPKIDQKKNTTDSKKNQPGINSFLTKLKST